MPNAGYDELICIIIELNVSSVVYVKICGKLEIRVLCALCGITAFGNMFLSLIL